MYVRNKQTTLIRFLYLQIASKMRCQNTWLIVLLVALCSIHLIHANTPNSLNDKDHEKKVKTMSKLALADDPRFNKMLPASEPTKDDGKNSTEDDYYEEYYTDYDDELKTNKLPAASSKTSSTSAPPALPIGKLKPIKGDDKVS